MTIVRKDDAMKSPMCAQIERYLEGALPGELREAFEAHLRRCSECYAEVRRERRLTELLSRTAQYPENVPGDLVSGVERRLRVSVRRRRALLVGGIAASLAACAIVWQAARLVGPQPSHVRSSPAPFQAPAADTGFVTEVTFDPPSDVIAVPIKTDNPNVTIVWVYPTVRPAEDRTIPDTQSPPENPRTPL